MKNIRSGELIVIRSESKKEYWAAVCFYVFWFTQMFCKGMGMIADSKLYRLLSLASLGFLGLKYLLTDWDFRSLVIVSCVLFVGALSYLLSDMMAWFLACLMICGAKGIDLKKLFLYTLYVRGTLFLCTVSLAVFGVVGKMPYETGFRTDTFELFRAIENVFKYLAMSAEDRVLFGLSLKGTYYRYELGFGEANLAHGNLLMIVLLYVFVRKNKLNVLECVGISLANFIVYYWTFSRTGLILVFFVLAMSLLLRVARLKKIFYAFGSFVFIACLLFSVLLAYTADFDVGEQMTWWEWVCQKLDSLLTTRLRLSAYAAQSFPCYYIFGARFRSGWNMLDSAYMNYWLRFGFVSCIIMTYAYTKRMEDCKKDDDLSLFLMLFIMALYGLTEMAFYSITTNFFLLTLRDVIYPEPNNSYSLNAGVTA